MALTDEQLWSEIYKQALTKKQVFGSGVPGPGLKGRFISVLARKLVEFWKRHQDTLIPVLAPIAIAALEAMTAAILQIEAVNIPGPD